MAILSDLKRDGAIEFPGFYPLSAYLPLSTSFPLLARVQKISEVEYNIHLLKTQRLDYYKQVVYVPPMAKPNLQAPDDKLFPLMEKVEEFIAGDSQVMLILGDSGGGKSTFNLENQL